MVYYFTVLFFIIVIFFIPTEKWDVKWKNHVQQTNCVYQISTQIGLLLLHWKVYFWCFFFFFFWLVHSYVIEFNLPVCVGIHWCDIWYILVPCWPSYSHSSIYAYIWDICIHQSTFSSLGKVLNLLLSVLPEINKERNNILLQLQNYAKQKWMAINFGKSWAENDIHVNQMDIENIFTVNITLM